MSYWDEEAEKEFESWLGKQMYEGRDVGRGKGCINSSPCPFCGYTKAILCQNDTGPGGWYLRCDKCFACGPQTRWHRQGKKEAHIKWSLRDYKMEGKKL